MTTARPILFSAPMIRALIDGRKTQTRRIAKFVPLRDGDNLSFSGVGPMEIGARMWALGSPTRTSWEERTRRIFCPYGQPGDLLWVRETWQVRGFAFGKPIRETRIAAPSAFHYRATDDGAWKPYWGKWRPSIFMPRWASRLTLEITEVRVQRLADQISSHDAIDEGLTRIIADDDFGGRWGVETLPPEQWHVNPARAFAALWDSINGTGSFDGNPWVWALTFKVHQSNVDTLLASRSEAA